MIIFNLDKRPIFSPFGPTIGYFKMSQSMVDYLNDSMDKKLDDFPDHIVAKVKKTSF